MGGGGEIEVEFIRSFLAASFRQGRERAGIAARQAGVRVPWAFPATFCQKRRPMHLARRTLSQALPGADFRATSCAVLVAQALRGRHRHDAQSTRITGQARRKCPTHAGYRACSPQGAIIRRAPGCAATWRGVRKFAAAMRPIHPLARAASRFASHALHLLLTPGGQTAPVNRPGLPSGRRRLADPPLAATDLTSIHPFVRRIRCATRSSRNASCCSSSACC